jgi:hypothetical protein
MGADAQMFPLQRWGPKTWDHPGTILGPWSQCHLCALIPVRLYSVSLHHPSQSKVLPFPEEHLLPLGGLRRVAGVAF